MKDSGVTRSLSKDGGKWKEGAAEMDAISVQALIDKLRDLAASQYLDAGAGAPVREATGVSGEGKKAEKVLISKVGEKFFATRENEPAAYEISKQSVEEIQKAAKDVKAPVAAPKPDPKKK